MFTGAGDLLGVAAVRPEDVQCLGRPSANLHGVAKHHQSAEGSPHTRPLRYEPSSTAPYYSTSCLE